MNGFTNIPIINRKCRMDDIIIDMSVNLHTEYTCDIPTFICPLALTQNYSLYKRNRFRKKEFCQTKRKASTNN